MESMTWAGPWVSTVSLMFNVVFILFLLAWANGLAGKLRPALALTRGELIIVYVMLTIGTSVAGHDLFQVLMSTMVTGTWYVSQPISPLGTLAKVWGETTPQWLVVSSPEVLYGFCNGDSTLYQWSTISAWIRPLMWWTGFTTVLILATVFLSVILRPLWADRERLTFPIIRLPFELTQTGLPLLRNRLFWLGFAAAAAVDLLNGLNYNHPAFPSLPMYIDVGSHIRNMPWSAIGWLAVTLYPSIIGLGFLIPVDLLLSCTFFFWWKLLYVITAAVGVQTRPGPWSESVFPYTIDQTFGACMGIAAASIYGGRHHFRPVWRRIIGRSSEVDDAGEALGLRFAFLGVLIGGALLVMFSRHAGMSLGLAAAFFGCYYLLAIAVARIRAEFRSPVHDLQWAGPDRRIAKVIGTVNLGVRDLGMLTQYYWFNRACRAHPIANSLEGIQMASWGRTSPRPLILGIILSILVAMIAAPWWWAHVGYRMGAATQWPGTSYFGREAYSVLQTWLEAPKPGDLVSPAAIGGGFATTLLLAFLRARFIGFPLHPVALPIAASWSIHVYWAPLFIAGVAKLLVLRYGGIRLYRRALPLFCGLIVGGSVASCAWPLVSAIFGLPVYNAFGW